MGSALSAPMEKNQEKMLAAQREMAMKQREWVSSLLCDSNAIHPAC